MGLKFNDLSETLKQRIRRDNPTLFNPVGRVETNSPKRPAVQALDNRVPKPASSTKSVGLRITLVTLRKRLLDKHDAVAYACKPLTDAIAKSLGIDDADKRLEWEYLQVKTTGTEGVMVKIEVHEVS